MCVCVCVCVCVWCHAPPFCSRFSENDGVFFGVCFLGSLFLPSFLLLFAVCVSFLSFVLSCFLLSLVLSAKRLSHQTKFSDYSWLSSHQNIYQFSQNVQEFASPTPGFSQFAGFVRSSAKFCTFFTSIYRLFPILKKKTAAQAL